MRPGDLVYPDFPENRLDWREEWPDNSPGIIIEETRYDIFVIMTSCKTKEVCGEYLVVLV